MGDPLMYRTNKRFLFLLLCWEFQEGRGVEKRGGCVVLVNIRVRTAFLCLPPFRFPITFHRGGPGSIILDPQCLSTVSTVVRVVVSVCHSHRDIDAIIFPKSCNSSLFAIQQ